MANYDDGVPEDWYPGYFLDPRNAWKWMPAQIPGWLPSAMVRTPPAIAPERWPEPSGSSTPGLLDAWPSARVQSRSRSNSRTCAA